MREKDRNSIYATIEAEGNLRELLILARKVSTKINHLITYESNRGPVGHYAEWLTLMAYPGSTRAKSEQTKGYDLIYRKKNIQVKSRVRETDDERKTKLDIRQNSDFDFLIYIVFDDSDYRVRSACKINKEALRQLLPEQESNVKWTFRPMSFIGNEGMEDVTERFRGVEL
jgi:hypothetical protein